MDDLGVPLFQETSIWECVWVYHTASIDDVQVHPGWRDVIMAFAKETARSATVANMANFASAAPSVERTVHMGNLCGAWLSLRMFEMWDAIRDGNVFGCLVHWFSSGSPPVVSVLGCLVHRGLVVLCFQGIEQNLPRRVKYSCWKWPISMIYLWNTVIFHSCHSYMIRLLYCVTRELISFSDVERHATSGTAAFARAVNMECSETLVSCAVDAASMVWSCRRARCATLVRTAASNGAADFAPNVLISVCGTTALSAEDVLMGKCGSIVLSAMCANMDCTRLVVEYAMGVPMGSFLDFATSASHVHMGMTKCIVRNVQGVHMESCLTTANIAVAAHMAGWSVFVQTATHALMGSESKPALTAIPVSMASFATLAMNVMLAPMARYGAFVSLAIHARMASWSRPALSARHVSMAKFPTLVLFATAVRMARCVVSAVSATHVLMACPNRSASSATPVSTANAVRHVPSATAAPMASSGACVPFAMTVDMGNSPSTVAFARPPRWRPRSVAMHSMSWMRWYSHRLIDFETCHHLTCFDICSLEQRLLHHVTMCHFRRIH